VNQIVTRRTYDGTFGTAIGWVPLVAAGGSFGIFGFAATQSRHPWSCAGTWRSLVVTVTIALPTPATWVVLVNGVPSVLTVTLPAGDLSVADLIHTVAVLPGDDLALQLTGAIRPAPGIVGGFSVEFAGTTPSESGYGIPPCGGTFDLAAPTTIGRFGGALGNGRFEACAAVPVLRSNTYSIVCTAGRVTRLDAKTFSGAPGAGVWTISLVLNTVIQNGSGGTVDTRAVITGAATQAIATFDLPVVPTDHLDVLVVRSGANAPFAIAHVGASVAFVSDAPDTAHLCGGNNNAVLLADVVYEWVGAEQERLTEADAAAPVGPRGFTATGLYIERTATPDPGQSWAHVLRRSGTSTAIAVAVADLNTSGLLLADAVFAAGDTIDLRVTPVGAPRSSHLYWGLALSTAPPPVPPPTPGVVYATRRLRTFRLPSDPDGRWLLLRTLDLWLQAGVGNAVDPGADPPVMVQLSRDGGQTWGPERWRAAGRRGAYTTRQLIYHAGRYREGAVRIVVTAPVPWRFLQAHAEIEPGTS
jgi:hypothetical protein